MFSVGPQRHLSLDVNATQPTAIARMRVIPAADLSPLLGRFEATLSPKTLNPKPYVDKPGQQWLSGFR